MVCLLAGQKGHANNQNDLETAGQPPQDVQLHNSECQVPGCGTVLWETLKRKVRICDVHRRALVLEMNGFQGRFCQQCSRVHDLSSFDGNRRGCRKRLRRRLYR